MCQWSQVAHEEKWFLSALNSGIEGPKDCQQKWIQGKSWQNIILFPVNYKAREGDLTGFYYDWTKQCLTVHRAKKHEKERKYFSNSLKPFGTEVLMFWDGLCLYWKIYGKELACLTLLQLLRLRKSDCFKDDSSFLYHVLTCNICCLPPFPSELSYSSGRENKSHWHATPFFPPITSKLPEYEDWNSIFSLASCTWQDGIRICFLISH